MPKRSCPFADASPLQLKVHVGPRELSRGVFAERCSREVFGECGVPWVERETSSPGLRVASRGLEAASGFPGEVRVEAVSCRAVWPGSGQAEGLGPGGREGVRCTRPSQVDF